MHLFWVLSSYIFAASFVDSALSKDLCTVKNGRGVVGRLANGREYCIYRGIPFAEPPVGRLRFQNPVLKFWQFNGNFTKDRSICPQLKKKSPVYAGNEDCLYLNVYTPHKKHLTLRPIVVWIHGGSFTSGSSKSDIKGFDGFLENDIVVVTINYRLGFLGFVSSEQYNISGNFGLKDQTTALKWVRKYIHVFGGDNRQVTLMGWSAGAASVTYHLYSNASKGLFHRAIAMSGSLLNPWAFLYNRQLIMTNYFKEINPSNSSKVLTAKFSQLIPHYEFDLIFSNFGLYHFGFIPSLESVSPFQFLTEPPAHLVDSRPASSVPLLLGHTNLELELLDPVHHFETHNPNFLNNDSQTLQMVGEYLHSYVKSKFSRQKEQHQFINRLSATVDLYHGIKKLAQKYSQMSGADVFMYRFAFDGFWNKKKKRSKVYSSDTVGAVHGDDLPYLFYDGKSEKTDEADLTDELEVRKRMVQMWSSFIKTGNPNDRKHNSTDSKLTALNWSVYQKEKQLLQIDKTMKMVRDYDTVSYDLWNDIHECLNKFQCDDFGN